MRRAAAREAVTCQHWTGGATPMRSRRSFVLAGMKNLLPRFFRQSPCSPSPPRLQTCHPCMSFALFPGSSPRMGRPEQQSYCQEARLRNSLVSRISLNMLRRDMLGPRVVSRRGTLLAHGGGSPRCSHSRPLPSIHRAANSRRMAARGPRRRVHCRCRLSQCILLSAHSTIPVG